MHGEKYASSLLFVLGSLAIENLFMVHAYAPHVYARSNIAHSEQCGEWDETKRYRKCIPRARRERSRSWSSFHLKTGCEFALLLPITFCFPRVSISFAREHSDMLRRSTYTSFLRYILICATFCFLSPPRVFQSTISS